MRTKLILFTVITAIFLLALAGQGWGATYYVDPNSGSPGSPYNSWATAAHTIQAVFDNVDIDGPSTIYVHGDSGSSTTYRELVTWGANDSGTSGNLVTLSSSTDSGHNGTPIINAADLVTSWEPDSTDLITDNWDDGDMSDWTELISNGTTSLDNAVYHSSSYSLKCDVTQAGGYAIRYKSFTASDDVTMEWWFRISSIGSNTEYVVYFLNSSTQLAQVTIIGTSGYLRLRYYDGASWQELDASTYAISANTWTKIKVRFYRHATAGIAQAWVSDNQVINSSGLDTGDLSYDVLRLASATDVITTWHDDINLDSTGQSNVWNATCTTEPYWVAFDETVGTYETAKANLNEANEWSWASSVLSVYSTSDPDTAYTNPGIEASKRDNCIDSNGQDYIDIVGLTAKYAHGFGNSTYGGIRLNYSDFSKVRNCTISYSGWAGIVVNQSNDTTIDGNTVSYCGNPRGAGTYGVGIRIVEDGDSSDNPTVTNNIVHHTYRMDGIRLEALSGAIDGGYVANNTSYQNRESGIELHYTSNTIVEKNKCYENGQNCTAGASGISLWYGQASNTIRYNLCYDNKEFAVYDGNGIIVDLTAVGNQYVYGNVCYGNDGPGVKVCEASGVYVYNNSCYDNMQDSHSTHGSYPQHNAEIAVLGTASDNNVVKNNIGYCTSSWYAVAIDDGAVPGGNTFDTNCWYKASGNWWYYDLGGGSDLPTWNGKTGVGTDIFGDPAFVDKENGNLALSATSPCIDAGADLGPSYNLDYNGKDQYGDGLFDIGAIRFPKWGGSF